MTYWKYLVTASLLGLSSCNFRNPDQIVVYDTIPAPENVIPSVSSNPEMTFSGKLPCADCAGIMTELTLVPDSMLYRLKEVYLNTGEGDKVFESTGTYAINRGTTQDTLAMVYQLNPGENDKIRAFKSVNDSALLVLDRNFDEINSALNYYLVRVQIIAPDSTIGN